MFSLLKKYFKKHLNILFLTMLLAFINILAITLIPYYIGKSIDSLFLLKDNFNPNSFDPFYLYILIIIGLITILVVFQYLFEYILGVFSEKILMELRSEVFTKLLKTDISYLDKNKRGDLISRVINDTDNISLGLQSSLKQFYSGMVQIILTLVIMLLINWILGLTVIILTPFGFLLSYFIAKRSKNYYKEQAKLVGETNAIFLEFLNNLETVISFKYGDEIYEKYYKSNEKLYKVGQKSQFIGSLTNPSTRLINNSTYAIIGTLGVILAILAINNNGIILGATSTIGIVSTFLQYSNQFAKPFNEISSCINEIQIANSSSKRILEILELDNEINEGNLELPSLIESIEFKDVSFGYQKDHLILKNLNFRIKNGQRVALVGPTGCGKTTLINLLLRFYEPNDGEILINGINIKKYKKSSLRDSFGLVLQDSWIFNASVFENVTYDSNLVDQNILNEVLEDANSKSFIDRLPQGIDTVINDDSGLSQGQKQLLSIARVMMSNPEIIVLDEATSNIDTRSERKIIKSLSNLMKNRTSFVIAHRLNTIVESDLILVIKDGSIFEEGTHQELLNKKGFYYELFNAQFSQN